MKRLLNSFSFAWHGLVHAWRSQPNFRVEAGIGILALIACVWLQVSPVPVLLLAAIVLSLELLNTAIESVCDLISPEHHPSVKIAKDTAAAAVLLSAIISVIIGLLLFLPPLIEKMRAYGKIS